jgi:hypothetical protein
MSLLDGEICDRQCDIWETSGAAETPHAAIPVKCLFCTAECLITQLGPPRLGDHPLLQ